MTQDVHCPVNPSNGNPSDGSRCLPAAGHQSNGITATNHVVEQPCGTQRLSRCILGLPATLSSGPYSGLRQRVLVWAVLFSLAGSLRSMQPCRRTQQPMDTEQMQPAGAGMQ
jgi:hypothetical protein